MSFRTVMRSSFIKTLRCARCNRQSYVPLTPSVSKGLSPLYSRGYATESRDKKFDMPDEYREEVFEFLVNNPPVMQALHDVIESMNKKGVKLDKEPTPSEMWKIMKDKDVMESLNKCISPQ